MSGMFVKQKMNKKISKSNQIIFKNQTKNVFIYECVVSKSISFSNSDFHHL